MTERSLFEAERETAWCPGCGNFGIRKALVGALEERGLRPWDVVLFSGIGQAAKIPHYIRINGFNGLHGRALPPAIGMRVANHRLRVIVESGDGDTYGEGGNHLMHTIRRNPDLAHLVHNNQIYGLTKGQASPTSEEEMVTTVQPHGPTSRPFHALRFALAMGAGYVARGFAGQMDHLQELIGGALDYRGYALVDILQPCVSFNKVNTFQWYQRRSYILGDEYDPEDYQEARKKSEEWDEGIPLGVIYRGPEAPVFRDRLAIDREDPLVDAEIDRGKVEKMIGEFKH